MSAGNWKGMINASMGMPRVNSNQNFHSGDDISMRGCVIGLEGLRQDW